MAIPSLADTYKVNLKEKEPLDLEALGYQPPYLSNLIKSSTELDNSPEVDNLLLCLEEINSAILERDTLNPGLSLRGSAALNIASEFLLSDELNSEIEKRKAKLPENLPSIKDIDISSSSKVSVSELTHLVQKFGFDYFESMNFLIKGDIELDIRETRDGKPIITIKHYFVPNTRIEIVFTDNNEKSSGRNMELKIVKGKYAEVTGIPNIHNDGRYIFDDFGEGVNGDTKSVENFRLVAKALAYGVVNNGHIEYPSVGVMNLDDVGKSILENLKPIKVSTVDDMKTAIERFKDARVGFKGIRELIYALNANEVDAKASIKKYFGLDIEDEKDLICKIFGIKEENELITVLTRSWLNNTESRLSVNSLASEIGWESIPVDVKRGVISLGHRYEPSLDVVLEYIFERFGIKL